MRGEKEGIAAGIEQVPPPPPPLPFFFLPFLFLAFPAFPLHNSMHRARQVQGDSQPRSCPGAAEMSALLKLSYMINIQPESFLLEQIELSPERFLQRFLPSADKRRDIAAGVYFCLIPVAPRLSSLSITIFFQ